jgi:predicted RNase H-like HicB family nuclease
MADEIMMHCKGCIRLRFDHDMHHIDCAAAQAIFRYIFIVVSTHLHLSKASDAKEHQMEHMIQLHIEKLPEGVYLATSDEVQGLIAQGRTIQETLEIARDVAKKLIEAQHDVSAKPLLPAREAFDYPLIIGS